MEIRCPAHCKYFQEHEEYQRRRLGPEFHRAWLETMEPFYRRRQPAALDFVIFLEITVYGQLVVHPHSTDKELLEALEAVERKLSPLEVIETPVSPLGERLAAAVQERLRARGDLSPEEAQGAVEALRRVIEELRLEREPRRALHGLRGHVEQFLGVPPEIRRMQEEQAGLIETPKILRPGEG